MDEATDGKVCTKCNEWKTLSEFHKDRQNKDGHRNTCKECAAIVSKLWVTDNPEQFRENVKSWQEANPDKVRGYQTTESFKERQRQYYADNKEKIKQRDTRDKQRTREHNRRARKRDAFVETVVPSIVFERDGWICQDTSCLLPVGPELGWPHPMSKSLDHKIPLSRGGKHSYDNTQLMHLACNLSKSSKIL